MEADERRSGKGVKNEHTMSSDTTLVGGVACSLHKGNFSLSISYTKRECTRHHDESSTFRAAQRYGPLNTILRANPFLEITDLLCRQSVDQKPQTAERHGVGNAPHTLKDEALHRTIHSVTKQSELRAKRLLNRKKDNLFFCGMVCVLLSFAVDVFQD